MLKNIVSKSVIAVALIYNPIFIFAQSSEIPVFTNVSEEAGLSTNLKPTFGNPIWGDMNNDDFIDLVFSQHGRTPSIYLNNQDSTFTQITARDALGNSFFDEHNDFHGYSFTDFNNDHILDLFITVGAMQGDPDFTKRDLLYQGNGDGTFDLATSAAGVENPTGRGRSSCWFDYDGDGNLDFLLQNVGTPSAFYLNSDEGTFTNIAATLGFDLILEGAVCSLVDYDNDGLMDIFLASEGLDETLLRQLPDGSFSDVTSNANIVSLDLTKSVAWADYNNDGFMDLYITRGANSNYRGAMEDLALDNTLYTNNGDGTFTDSTSQAGLQGSYNTWAAVWGDVNNDGNVDLFVANAGEIDGAGNRNFLYLNDGDGTFDEAAVPAEIAAEDGMEIHRYSSTSMGDFDNDGALDIVIEGGGRGVSLGVHELFRNQGTRNNYLRIKLIGVAANAPTIGSTVSVSVTDKTQTIQHTGATNGVRSSQSIQPLHFGIGDTTAADVDIQWPAGARVSSQSITNIAANQLLTVEEGVSIVRGYGGQTDSAGCSIWRNDQGWWLRCRGEMNQRVEFSGQISSNDGITTVIPRRLEANDEISSGNNIIDFTLFAKGSDDVINFTTSGDTVSFDIYIDGEHQSQSIKIGKYKVIPATLPLSLTE